MSAGALATIAQPQPEAVAWRAICIGIAIILVAAIVGYLLFPNNLALLTRIIAIMLLVLSLDLVTGYCGVATLGHAALFGAGAYAAGIAAAHFGITEPLTMIASALPAAPSPGSFRASSSCAGMACRSSSCPSPSSICSTRQPTRRPPVPAAATAFPASRRTPPRSFRLRSLGPNRLCIRHRPADRHFYPAAHSGALAVWHALPRYPAGSCPRQRHGRIGQRDPHQDVRDLRRRRRASAAHSTRSRRKSSVSTA